MIKVYCAFPLVLPYDTFGSLTEFGSLLNQSEIKSMVTFPALDARYFSVFTWSCDWFIVSFVLVCVKHRGWKLNNLTSVIHYSLGVSSNYSLFFLSSCWLFIIHNRFRVQRIALAKFGFNYNTFGNNITQLIFITCYSVLLAIGSTI